MNNLLISTVEKYLLNAGIYHSAGIIEERKIARIVKDTAVEQIDNTVNEQTAIKMYSQSIEEDIRDEFVSLANDIVKECNI